MTGPSIPPIIAPLIRRHAEDAAFYWGLLDASANSPSLNLESLSRFGDMLTAHLEGLQVAGQDGWAPCLADLERWRKPANAFVCAYQAFTLDEAAFIEPMLVQIRARPDELLRGVISAFAWMQPEQAAAIIRQWTGADSEFIQQVAALRAAALRDTDALGLLAQPIECFLVSPDAHVRAAACRVAATMPPGSLLIAALKSCLDDSAIAVRAEAAIALHALGRQALHRDVEADIALAETVWQCVVGQVAVFNESTGWYRHQALRRLQRWVQNLATMVPLGHEKVSALLDFMPARISLRFVVHHGDPAHLAYATAKMSHPDTSRYAGWVWQTITGVDLESTGLSLPEPPTADDSAGISDARLDADDGLPLPDPDAIARYPLANLSLGQRRLAGLVLTPLSTLAVLDTAPQAQRNVAIQYLRHFYPNLKLSLRGPITHQLATMAHLRRQLTNEDVQ